MTGKVVQLPRVRKSEPSELLTWHCGNCDSAVFNLVEVGDELRARCDDCGYFDVEVRWFLGHEPCPS